MQTDPTTATTSTSRPIARGRWARRATVAGIALAAASLLVGCSGSGSKDDKAADATTSTATADSSTTVADGSTTVAPDTGDQGSNGSNGSTGSNAGTDSGSNGSNTGSNGSNSGSTNNGPKPVIYSFDTPENIDCHNGNLQDFSASWTTQNATKTTISIDGPGVYKTYGPNDSDSLPFNCSSSHTFLLTAYGPGGTTTKSITLQPRNVQQPSTDDTDEDPADSATTTSTTVAP
ncbi:hypothetical protein KSP35_16135 [Aquihabitans sp. G128]|uniref:hypothetical protein n=1 Tax=Aquihabitans sp. G128 TaxID=2849779 RepID=UPI001C229ACB|nr:hypothetical protein [Aquihabitans sp. G128]QXC59894.1 hypothetical protein KSP35_16135 [Aquihabitans sp. G128]